MESLSAYLASKNALYDAYKNNPTTVRIYQLTKYGKFPVRGTGKKPTYIHVRPKDLVQVVSLTHNDVVAYLSIRFICMHDPSVEETTHKPSWTAPKVAKWIAANTIEVEGEQEDG